MTGKKQQNPKYAKYEERSIASVVVRIVVKTDTLQIPIYTKRNYIKCNKTSPYKAKTGESKKGSPVYIGIKIAQPPTQPVVV